MLKNYVYLNLGEIRKFIKITCSYYLEACDQCLERLATEIEDLTGVLVFY